MLSFVSFQKRFKWVNADVGIEGLFWNKCATRTKNNLRNEREKSANMDHPEHNDEHLHEYNPSGVCQRYGLRW